MKRLRKITGIIQANLAEIINSSTNYIAEIEIQKKFTSPGKLEDIAKALNVEPYELIMPFNEMLNSEDKKSITYRAPVRFGQFLIMSRINIHQIYRMVIGKSDMTLIIQIITTVSKISASRVVV